MTEDEAKTKWCPFVRFADATTEGTFNRYADGCWPVNVNCIGSACMVWRKHGTVGNAGYCGLAGEP